MRAINHALTGAIVGLTVHEPVVALPVALASHFVCDAIPHWGFDKPTPASLRSAAFKYSLMIDVILCFLLVLIIFINQPVGWVLAILCAFAATSPDLISIRQYRSALRHEPFKPNRYEKFASGIQWFEKPIGIYVEIVWLIAASSILTALL